MKKALLFIFSFCLSSAFYAQLRDSVIREPRKGFNAGDIILNANYGYPQVNAALVRTGVNLYYKFIENQTMSFSLTNSGVFNAKAEYGLMETLGLGLAVSYWDMNLKIQNNYTSNGSDYTDELNLNLSVLGMGVRGNYHFVEELETSLIDPYMGFTIGATKYTKDLVFSSTNPERQIPEWVPERVYKLKDGWATYISSTLGIRFYPVRYVGINAEVGWDKGALLFGGVVFSFGSKPIQSLQD